MIRNCFLCHGKVDNIFKSQWLLPGLPQTEIGYSVCMKCGSVCQSPALAPEKMDLYYRTTAVYTNPGREEAPSASKIRDVNEQVHFIERGMSRLPQSILQIGSSDGFTLSQFKNAGVPEVMGIELSEAAIAIARRRYGVHSINANAETYQFADSFELILLTHVLEHLYEPQKLLQRCNKSQSSLNEGFIYIEVPLLTDSNTLCPGFFTFEHTNYYNEFSLLKSLVLAGYTPISIIKHLNSNLSPVIGVLATTKKQGSFPISTEPAEKNKTILADYWNGEVEYWQSCVNSAMKLLQGPGNVYLWGAGIHTCQLLANTTLLNAVPIAGLTDSSQIKWHMTQGNWECQPPTQIDWQQGDKVIISSFASQEEIYKSLQWLRDKGVITLRLHPPINR